MHSPANYVASQKMLTPAVTLQTNCHGGFRILFCCHQSGLCASKRCKELVQTVGSKRASLPLVPSVPSIFHALSTLSYWDLFNTLSILSLSVRTSLVRRAAWQSANAVCLSRFEFKFCVLQGGLHRGVCAGSAAVLPRGRVGGHALRRRRKVVRRQTRRDHQMRPRVRMLCHTFESH